MAGCRSSLPHWSCSFARSAKQVAVKNSSVFDWLPAVLTQFADMTDFSLVTCGRVVWSRYEFLVKSIIEPYFYQSSSSMIDVDVYLPYKQHILSRSIASGDELVVSPTRRCLQLPLRPSQKASIRGFQALLRFSPYRQGNFLSSSPVYPGVCLRLAARTSD